MTDFFETFTPNNSLVKKFVDYYYLDIKPDNVTNEFQCFPHYNNTISLYKSHIRLQSKEILFDENAGSFQIFTPLRDNVLTVKQSGKVHRVVIVFHPLGVHQFFRGLDFSNNITNVDFLSANELQQLFSTKEINVLNNLLDKFLEKRFMKFGNPIVEKLIHYILNHYEDFSVAKITKELGFSRQHLTRIFKSHLGISLKKFHEIVVFRKTMNKKLFENSNQSFTELAYEFNFSDQSHLIKTYRTLTDCSPKSFFAKGTLLGKKDTFWHINP